MKRLLVLLAAGVLAAGIAYGSEGANLVPQISVSRGESFTAAFGFGGAGTKANIDTEEGQEGTASTETVKPAEGQKAATAGMNAAVVRAVQGVNPSATPYSK